MIATGSTVSYSWGVWRDRTKAAYFHGCARRRLLTGERLAHEKRSWCRIFYEETRSPSESQDSRLRNSHTFGSGLLEFDASAWDREIERDLKAEKLDALADEGLRDYAAGKSTEF